MRGRSATLSGGKAVRQPTVDPVGPSVVTTHGLQGPTLAQHPGVHVEHDLVSGRAVAPDADAATVATGCDSDPETAAQGRSGSGGRKIGPWSWGSIWHMPAAASPRCAPWWPPPPMASATCC